ncbi:MAG: metallophosphoesterase [Bacteroidales bacterium]|nr:metallophosphoesterase [Bacteroidales bacterium]
MKTLKIYNTLFLVFLVCSCSKNLVDYQDFNQDFNEANRLTYAMPHVKIAVLGGLNYLDPSLMIDCLDEGSDFRKNFSFNNSVFEFSNPVLDAAVSEIMTENPDLLLITGKLTCRGEKISHLAIAATLKEISEQGIKVFVIPGALDIDDPLAMAYSGSGSVPTPSVTEEEFVSIYNDFGFKNAISRDPNSLSYLSQPFNKLWILGIDSRPALVKPETIEWISHWCAIAKKNNITVLPILSSNVIEAWTNEAILAPPYMIEEHEIVEEALTKAGLRIIFTSPAVDISMNSDGENVLYDISTMPILTPPFPFRIINLDPNFMQIETRYLTSVNATVPGGAELLDYSYNLLIQNLTRLLTYGFSAGYGLPVGDISTPGTAAYYALHIARADATYYGGDEQIPPEELEISEGWPELFKQVLRSMYTDSPPPDRQYTVDMREKIKE